jgi:phosphoglycolate phosphatase
MTYLRAVLFDLDGTLVDSAVDIAESLNDLLAEQGRAPYDLAAVKRMVGEGVLRLVEKAFGEAAGAAQRAERFMELYTPRSARLTVPVEGAFAALDHFKSSGVPLAVCTNKPDDAAREVLENFGLLPYFREVIGGASGLPRKPDPAILLEAARRLGAKPAETLMVGDSLPDVAAARAAGMKVMVVDSGYGEVAAADLGADLILETLAALPARHSLATA